MPVHRGAVTFARFWVDSPKRSPSEVTRWLTGGLKARAFEPIDKRGEEERSAGFVELEDNEAIEFPVGNLFHGERAIFAWRIDKLRIPASELKAELEKWMQAFEQENKRAPNRAEKTENKGQIRHMLKMRAAPATKIFDITWNLSTQQLQIWAASRTIVEEVQTAIEAALEVKLVDRVPAAIAVQAGIPEDALTPTAELVGMEGVEVQHGQA